MKTNYRKLGVGKDSLITAFLTALLNSSICFYLQEQSSEHTSFVHAINQKFY